MDLIKILFISEVLGNDYDPDDLHFSPIAYIFKHILGIVFIVSSTILLNYMHILGSFFLIGSAIVYSIMISVNNHDDISMLLTVPLSVFIGCGIIILIN